MIRHHDSRPAPEPLRHIPSPAVPASGVPRHAGVRRIPSADLFVSGAVVEIDHGGEIYRLRHTRRGKLILTK
ncbi:MAG: hemin uptake protein HemP [Thiotrichales bacterium]|nr:hemin uptake protein HemP [Thiotrichales bacterium]MCY4283897.1 hemin uptake protein HemP [Thiotrichales bacterium]MCY4349393.1 hemin uptake protein HemP [Thiotrichales bacterium]